ncbi:MAG: hypothetical protein P1Q69_00835 [Candidatus Thorarchaeota archaeon]|nr:hypothetical protein [Candidatus Thorarchaeota archaeon]
MDVNGVKTDYLNEKIERITGINRQGGIRNPRFVEGKELESLRARLVATANSDFHLREDGRAEYYEGDLDRLGIFKETLRNFGEMKLNEQQRDGYIQQNVPSPMGKVLEYWGVQPGNKSFHNTGLSPAVLGSSLEAALKYLEDLIPQDGSFSSAFEWTRCIAIRGGREGIPYGFESKISDRCVNLLKSHEYTKIDSKGNHRITIRNLDTLLQNDNPEIAAIAEEIMSAVFNFPCNLILDEKEIAERADIKVNEVPREVRYYPKTGKVTVAWVARTASVDDTIRWALLCPPNDVRKKFKVEKFLEKRKDAVERIMNELKSEGFEL